MTDYVIRTGDSLYAIAKRYGTTVKALQEVNNITNVNKITAGKKIIIPDGKGVTVEHNGDIPDARTPKTFAAARARELAEIEAMKKASQNAQGKPLHSAKSSNTADLVAAEMRFKDVPVEGGRKFGKNFAGVEYWTEKIDRIASEFDFPKEIMIAKVSREVTFQPNKISGDQRGCMQIRPTAVRAMFPGAPGNWFEKYKELDEKLLNDILYKKDKNGNYLKDSKGNMIPKYSSWRELHAACKNDEISLKVGILYDKMQLAESLTAEKYGSKKVYPHISETIAQLKEKTSVTPEENLKYIKKMETRYNGSPSYGKAITDSIMRMGFDMRTLIIRKV